MNTKLFNIVLIGSPNVGKSSIFNFLIKKNEATVRDEDGTTVDFRSKKIDDVVLWDTPGSYELIDVPFDVDQVVYVVENVITQNDINRYVLLKNKYQDKLIVVVNKIDLGEDDYSVFEHYIKISIKNKTNLYFLSNIFNFNLSYKNDKKVWAILGRPNVGKSSLANLLYKQDINKVENKPGTTKEYLPLEIEDNIILDTPGQCSKAVFPLYSNIFGVIVVLDSNYQKQDLRFIGLAIKRKKPIIVLMNKIDVKHNKNIEVLIRRVFNVDVFNISCLKKKGISQVLKQVSELEKNFFKRIPTNLLNNWFQNNIKEHFPKVKFISHVKCAPHVFYVDHEITPDKERMLVKKLQNQFGLNNLSVEVKYKSKDQLSDADKRKGRR